MAKYIEALKLDKLQTDQRYRSLLCCQICRQLGNVSQGYLWYNNADMLILMVFTRWVEGGGQRDQSRPLPFELKALGGKVFPECCCLIHVLNKPWLCVHTVIQQLQLEQPKERQEVMTREPEPNQSR